MHVSDCLHFSHCFSSYLPNHKQLFLTIRFPMLKTCRSKPTFPFLSFCQKKTHGGRDGHERSNERLFLKSRCAGQVSIRPMHKSRDGIGSHDFKPQGGRVQNSYGWRPSWDTDKKRRGDTLTPSKGRCKEGMWVDVYFAQNLTKWHVKTSRDGQMPWTRTSVQIEGWSLLRFGQA